MRKRTRIGVLSLAWAMAACVGPGGPADGTRGNDGIERQARDLTLAMPGSEAQTASALELSRPEPAQALPAGDPSRAPEASGEAPRTGSLAGFAAPAPATVPEVHRILRPGAHTAAQPAPPLLGVSVLHSGQTVGAPTPQPIEFTRPSPMNEPLPEDYYAWVGESSPEPRRGVIIAIGGRGGACDGPGRGAFVRPRLQR